MLNAPCLSVFCVVFITEEIERKQVASVFRSAEVLEIYRKDMTAFRAFDRTMSGLKILIKNHRNMSAVCTS